LLLAFCSESAPQLFNMKHKRLIALQEDSQ
jgi:hypothetical protein